MKQSSINNHQGNFHISGKIVDVINRRIYPGTIHIADGIITRITEEKENVQHAEFIIPGLIDAHVHIESSMLVPSEFARLAVVHGTVGTVSDPHEIANVLGAEGIHFMLDSAKKTPFKFAFGVPSCVPATDFETAGAKLDPDEVLELLQLPEMYYLAEMMNYPGVIYEDPMVIAKIAAAQKVRKPIDGHAPALSGKPLQKYLEAGISTEHECSTIDEALEKISYGTKILIREGSAARNADALLPLLATHPEMVMFCSDDIHPDQLVDGHINLIILKALKAGYNLFDVLRCATVNPKTHYNLKNGLLREGDAADMVVVSDLNTFDVCKTFINGVLVAQKGKTLLPWQVSAEPNRFAAKKISPESLLVSAKSENIRVIQAIDGEIHTLECIAQPWVENGMVVSDVANDILKLVVINRYENRPPTVGFIKGFGLKQGAIASTVAHDSHNIIAVGTTDADLAKAINLLIEHNGGVSAVSSDIEGILPLPVAGLMSPDDGYEVAKSYKKLDEYAKQMGSVLQAPFMTLSFMALLVIPELKISDKGLFDGKSFAFTSLFC
ncbi:MAG TPA: adenine deaminase [Bacteroidales bacterium]|nr:adenine deaminase [Bacteroidales bacterium]